MKFKKRLSNNDCRKMYFAKPVDVGNAFSHTFDMKYESKFKGGKVIYLPNLWVRRWRSVCCMELDDLFLSII